MAAAQFRAAGEVRLSFGWETSAHVMDARV